jgi:hypothetical protein
LTALMTADKIENPPAEDTEEVTADAFMALLASYNLQFEGMVFMTMVFLVLNLPVNK